MKALIVEILATTAVALVILALFFSAFRFEPDFARTVFMCLGVNTIVQGGRALIQLIELRHLALEVVLEILYICGVLVVFGLVSDVSNVTPIPILIILGALTHIVAVFLNVASDRHDSMEINKLIQRRNRGKKEKEEPAEEPEE